MRILAKVNDALQRLFGEITQVAAKESGVIQRTRVFTPLSLAQTFILGFLRDPRASDEKLAQMAGECGAAVTPQAVEQRQTARLVDFLERLFRGATQILVGSSKSLAPILERFSSVTIIDSTTITLPDALQSRFRGCGIHPHQGGNAVMKLQTELDLRSGALEYVGLEQGRSPDSATVRQKATRQAGSLRISDLGYFSLPVFAAMMAAGAYFLSRLQFSTHVFLQAPEGSQGDGTPLALLRWLAQQAGPWIDVPVYLGQEQRLPCRFIAWRVPPEQANRRRQKLRRDMHKKHKRPPGQERLAWCDWTFLVTNVPLELLTPAEAAVLYRARWQVELLFKRWKSQGLVAELHGARVDRQMVRVWSRLLAALLRHWLMVGTVWGDATRSWWKVYQAIRDYGTRLAKALADGHVEELLQEMAQVFAKTCRRDPRSKPGTIEMLNNVNLLDFRLT